MTHKEKIVQFSKHKGLSKADFCRKCGFSISYLDSKGSITSNNLGGILKNFRDLNLNWLLFDEGEMIKNAEYDTKSTKREVRESPENYSNNYKDKYINLLEENRLLHRVILGLEASSKDNLIQSLKAEIEKELDEISQGKNVKS